MNKEITTLLQQCNISVKWKNFNSWQKEECDNLHEACLHYGITISKNKDQYANLTISFDKGWVKLYRKTNQADLERDLITVLSMYYCYLGDTTKITTRFGTRTIN